MLEIMNKKTMILPAAKATSIRLVRLPEDFDKREAYRFVTGLITAWKKLIRIMNGRILHFFWKSMVLKR